MLRLIVLMNIHVCGMDSSETLCNAFFLVFKDLTLKLVNMETAGDPLNESAQCH